MADVYTENKFLEKNNANLRWKFHTMRDKSLGKREFYMLG